MDPTKLPTDNLYKFMALAGLALAGFCVWLYWRFRESWASDVAAAKEKVAFARAVADRFTQRISALKSANASKRAEFHAIKARYDTATEGPAATRRELMPTLEEVQALDREFDSLSAELDAIEHEQSTFIAEQAKAEAAADAMLARFERQRPAVLALPSGALVGCVIAAVGFSLWFYKLQWYIDHQTKADFEDHMAELAAKRIARANAAASVAH